MTKILRGVGKGARGNANTADSFGLVRYATAKMRRDIAADSVFPRDIPIRMGQSERAGVGTRCR